MAMEALHRKSTKLKRAPLWQNLLLSVTSVVILLMALEVAGRVRLLLRPMSKPLLVYAPPPLNWQLDSGYTGEYADIPAVINSEGFRDDPLTVQKPEGEFRVLVLGDSRTFGFGVPFEDTFAQILERELNKRAKHTHFSVINAGVPGYTAEKVLIFLRTRGLNYQPDVVIVGPLTANDRFVFLKDAASKSGPIVQSDNQLRFGYGIWVLMKSASNLLDRQEWYKSLRFTLFSNLNRLLRGGAIKDEDMSTVVPLTEYRQHLMDIVALCEGKNAKVMFVTLVDNPGVYNHAERGVAYYEQGKIEPAQEELERALNYELNYNPIPYYYRGLIAEQRGDRERADNDFLLAEVGATYFPLRGIERSVQHWEMLGKTIKREKTRAEIAEMPAMRDPRYVLRDYIEATRAVAQATGSPFAAVDEDDVDEEMFFAGDVNHPTITAQPIIADKILQQLMASGFISE
jgi:lysophospholipase L1-like esterase